MSSIGYATLSVIPSAKGFGKALSSQVDPELGPAGQAGGKAFGGGMLDAAKKFAAPLAGLFAVGAIVDFFSSAASAAMEDERSVVALSTAMDNLGMSSQNAVAEQFIDGLSRATGVADDELRPAMQKLLTATGDLAQSQKLLSLAQDISAGTGKDLASVSQALARASTGQLSALTRLGVPLDANIIKTRDFAAVQAVLTEKFGGQAAAAAGTYEGQLKRLTVAADEATETVGYALLGALEDVSKAFGFGVDGATGMVTALGATTASFITGSGQIVAALAGVTAGMKAAEADTIDWGDNVRNTLIRVVPMLATTVIAYEQVTDAGDRSAQAAAAAAAEAAGISALYAGYKANSDRATSATVALEQSADDAAAALADMKESFLQLTRALSASQSMDNFRKSLYDLDDTLAGNKRSFRGMGDAAKENRDTLRTAFSDAASIAQKWAEDNGKSAKEAQDYYDGLARKIVNQFTKDGFSRADIKEFLGGEGIWTGPMKDALSAAERAGLARAYSAGRAVGGDLGLGVIAGIAASSAAVQAASARIIAQAEAAARRAAQSQSPSKLFAAIGKDLTLGLVQGIREGGDNVRATLQDTYKEWYTSTRNSLKEGLDAAKAELAAFSASVSSAIMSGIDFGAAAPEFDEAGNLVGASFVDSLQAQADRAQQFAAKVKELVVLGLSEAALQQVLAAGVTAGTAIANELITGGATTIATTNALVASTQAAADQVGAMAAVNFYGAGVMSAQQTYNGFKANFGRGGPAYLAMQDVMDNLAESMNRSSTITVTTVNRLVTEAVGYSLPGRAAGGPVVADRAYWVGERGPEVFIPNSSGSIVPNGSLDFAPAAARTAAVNGAPFGPTGGGLPAITVRVFVGDRELTDIVDTRIEAADGRSLDYVSAGRRF